MNPRAILISSCFLVFFVSALYAQQNTATVTGTVRDSSGAAVPAASVTLENINRGVTRTATSDSSGFFSFDFVVIGTYRLTVTQSGFASAVRSGLDLTAGQVLDLPLQLELQQQTQTVEVMAEAAALDTTSVQQTAGVNITQVHELPVAHLDWTNLLALSTGMSKPTQATSVNSTSPLGSGETINGLPSAGYNFTVDGTNASSNMEFIAYNFYQAAGLINTVNNDSIEEVSTARGVPSATIGGGMSGSINIVTKGGTNTYHGSLYETNEVSLFDARNQFLSARPRTTFNIYGGSLGLPLIKNKLFFFGSYEQASLSATKAITGGVPSPYLISISPAVYNPLFALFPKAPQSPTNPTAVVSQYSGTASNLQRDDNGVYRLDYYLNPNNIFSARWIRSRPFQNSPALLASNPRDYFDNESGINVTHTHSSAQWTENTRFGYNQVNMDRLDALLAVQFPLVSFGGWNSGGSKLLHWYGNYTTIEENVSYVHGKHTIQFGGLLERAKANELQIMYATLLYSTMAQFLNDTPSQMTLELAALPSGQPYFEHSTSQIGEYIQDDYRVTKDLTLNLGLRYDIWTVPGESGANRVFNRGIDPNNPQLGGGFGPIINYYYKPDYTQFQPRIGLAYNVFGSGKTVIRAGFGKLSMGHTLYEGVTQTYQISAAVPFAYVMSAAQTQASGFKYPYSALGYVQQLTSLQAAGVLSSNLPVTEAINTHYPDPYSLQWMIGVQQTLPWAMTLEAIYNANKGLHEEFDEIVNQANRTTGIAPVPNFGGVPYITLDDRSNYNSLQTTLRRKFQHGLMFASGFTWSRVMSFGDADNYLQGAPQNPYNFEANYGPAPYDVKFRSVTNVIYDVPLDKWTGLNGGIGKALLGGWQLSGVYTAQSGLPVTVTDSASSNATDRPDAAGAGVSPYVANYQSGIHQYLSPAAFVQIPISTLSAEQIRPGNLGRSSVRAPGSENLDATLAKVLVLRERFRFQLRADTFNTLNHTNLAGLVTTINSATFGRLTAATARTMQLGARITF